jgi:hypothetical protein
MSNRFNDIEASRVSLSDWRDKKSADKTIFQQRQASEVILFAIALCPDLQPYLLLKGGTLMGIAFDSPRQTTDLDFTMTSDPINTDKDQVRKALNRFMKLGCDATGNDHLELAVQQCDWKPRPNANANHRFPALELSIGYAERHGNAHRRLLSGTSPNVVRIDVSFNEPESRIQILEIDSDLKLLAYSWIELVAEKFRALLQQVHKDRPQREAKMRKQDVYDIDRLITKIDVGSLQKAELLLAMQQKCRSKEIEPEENSFDDPELKALSERGWKDLILEVDELPDFEDCYARVVAFYRSLPWTLIID